MYIKSELINRWYHDDMIYMSSDLFMEYLLIDKTPKTSNKNAVLGKKTSNKSQSTHICAIKSDRFQLDMIYCSLIISLLLLVIIHRCKGQCHVRDHFFFAGGRLKIVDCVGAGCANLH